MDHLRQQLQQAQARAQRLAGENAQLRQRLGEPPGGCSAAWAIASVQLLDAVTSQNGAMGAWSCLCTAAVSSTACVRS